jgi:3'(2'), 5'-bisphosphate nucleotidase
MVSANADAVSLDQRSLDILSTIARDAGHAILEHYSKAAGSTAKADGSPLTLADTSAERVIVDALRDWDPEIPVISEETEAAPYDERKTWKRFWLVDPLDGTKEFLAHNGEFTVNIALIENGEPVLGVVYAPALDSMYTAAKGLGAWKTAEGLTARIHHDQPVRGAALRVIESRSHASPELEAYLATITVSRRIPLGSSLKFCKVAEGSADIYPRLGPTMEWDVAAGDCIFRNSAATGQHKSPLTYNKPDLRNGSFVLGAPL